MIAILFSISTFFATLIGGLFTLKQQKRLNLILGFTAGVILGVIAFHVLPEIFELVHEHAINPMLPMAALVVGFMAFHVMEKAILMHGSHEHEYGAHRHPHVGLASALALAGHSFLDGVSIGLAFQIDTTAGIAVTIAVLAHKFTDGISTVSLMLAHNNDRKRVIGMLLVASIAPVLGAISTLFFELSAPYLAAYLGFFAGFLLYVNASDILPQAHEKGSSKQTIGLTLLGIVLMYGVSLVLESSH